MSARDPRPLPLLVGEANPLSPDPAYALYPWPASSSGGRLARMLGLTEAEYLSRFDRRNLEAERPRKGWDRELARNRAEALLIANPRADVIMLGARVADAFRKSWLVEFQSFPLAPSRELSRCFVRLPHPSGRCQSWNEPMALARLRDVMRPYLDGGV